MINGAIKALDWDKLFDGKNIHDQFSLFEKIILIIFHNFILNETAI